MKTWVMVWIGLAGIAWGDTVTVPWGEFSELYRQRIEDDLRGQVSTPAPEDRYVLHRVALDLDVRDGYLGGTMVCEGKALEGEPCVPLVGPSVLVEAVSAVDGGELVQVDGMTSLIPTGDLPFRVALDILVPLEDSGPLLSTRFDCPQAVQRTLRLNLPDELQLVEEPGLMDGGGVIHLASGDGISLRLVRIPEADEEAPVELDALTRITLRGKRLACTTYVHPLRAVHAPLEILLPPGARWKAGSLPSTRVEQLDETTYRIRLKPGAPTPFHVQYTMETAPSDSRMVFALPRIAGNEGEDGFLVVDQPESGQIELLPGDDEITLARVATPATLRASVPAGIPCVLVPRETGVILQISRFTAVATPPAVLDAIRFFTSFEENGGRLSQLSLEVPAAVGPRLVIERIPDAAIWSLTVNGDPRQVRTGADGNWIIALDPGGTSKVELAYLTRSDALALQGRIEARMPGVGLPAKRVSVGIGLPERLELLSIEGPVTPASHPPSGPPDAFAGTPYYFSRSYYEGKGLDILAYYKEPAATDLTTP